MMNLTLIPRPLSRVSEMLTDLTLLCFPLSIPSFYLAYRLHRRNFLGTVFNQQIALMMVYSGEDCQELSDQ